MVMEPSLEAATVVTIGDNVEGGTASSATVATLTVANEPTSFEELHAESQRPWHERAYADGRRSVPRPVHLAHNWLDKLTKADNTHRTAAEKAAKRERKRKRQRSAPLAKLRDVDWTQRDAETLAAVKRRLATDYAHCLCVQCTLLQREQQAPPAFRCPVRYCGEQFGDDVVLLLEHQVQSHGRVFPQCRRVRMALFGQERGVVPFPPVTVFVGQQVLCPGVRPTEWTLARVDVERRMLAQQLFESPQRHHHPKALHIWDAFTMAFHQVRQGGQAQLHAQYEAALEYYESSLVHPVTTRRFQDGTSAVGGGRNWLCSPELPHAANLTPFRFEQDGGTRDSSEEEGQTSSSLLMETGVRVQDAKTSVAPAVVAATTAALSEVAAAGRSLYAHSLDRQDAKVAATIQRDRKRPVRKAPRRCSDCGRRIDHRNHVCAPRQPRQPRCCKLCRVSGHSKVTCPDKATLAPKTGLPAALRCGNCGLYGHTRKTCYQPTTNGSVVVKRQRLAKPSTVE